MKFCYLDESGTGQATVTVVAGVVLDAQRMSLTKREWSVLFDQVCELTKHRVKEIHTGELIRGYKSWNGVPGHVRNQVVDMLLEWLCQRKHSIVFSAIQNSKYDSSSNERKSDLKNIKDAAVLHAMLSLQKEHQKEQKNKGHTVLIFDSGTRSTQITDLILGPPAWSASYCEKKGKHEILDQVVDVPHFVDSSRVPMIQLADLVGYVLRRFAELKDCGIAEDYPGELAAHELWIAKIKPRCLKTPTRYPKTQPCETAKFFTALAPASLREL